MTIILWHGMGRRESHRDWVWGQRWIQLDCIGLIWNSPQLRTFFHWTRYGSFPNPLIRPIYDLRPCCICKPKPFFKWIILFVACSNQGPILRFAQPLKHPVRLQKMNWFVTEIADQWVQWTNEKRTCRELRVWIRFFDVRVSYSGVIISCLIKFY